MGVRYVFLFWLIFSVLFNSAANASDEYGLMPLDIVVQREGFRANGQRYVDPQGRIEKLSRHSDTGFVTYLVQGAGDEYLVKMVAPLGRSKAKVIGHLEYRKSQWHFTDHRGEQFSGDKYILISRGLLMIRGKSVITYINPDYEPSTLILPDGYSISPYQSGDVAYSKHILIYSRREIKAKFGGFLSLKTNAASNYDIAFFNIETGQINLTLNMRVNGQNLAQMSQKLYTFNLPKGMLIVALEDDYKRVVIRRLGSKKKVVAFERKNGIAYVKAEQQENGAIRVVASLGFSNKELGNAEQFYDDH